MAHRFTGSDEKAHIRSDDFVEALCETLIALATVAAICISVIGLAAHLADTRAVRGAAGHWVGAALEARTPSGIAGAHPSTQFD